MATFDEIREGFDNLVLDAVEYANSLPDGSDEKVKAHNEVRKLYSLRMEQGKADDEYEDATKKRIEEIEKRKEDAKFREKQMKQQHKEFIQKAVIDTATTGVKLAIFGVIGRWAGNLETIGTMSTSLGKSFFREGMNLLGLKK